MAVALCSTVATAARATCPGGLLESEVANNNPQFLQACQGSPPACPEAPTPTVIANTQPQEVVLTTDIAAGFVPTEIWWRAERYNSSTYTWDVVWEHVSDEDLNGAGPYTVTFGAPGLTENAQHAFRVSWRDANGFLCWSDRSQSVVTTPFSGVGPAPPPATSYKVEDSFERAPTEFKCDAQHADVGDGLGPNAVWMDCQIGTGGVGPHIADDGHAAYFFLSSWATHMGRHAGHRHNFSEVRVRVANDVGVGIAYNFQVTAREHMAGAPLQQRGYGAKLVYKIRDCFTSPSLTIFRLQDEYALAGCSPSQGNPPLAPWGILIPDPANPTGKCDATPPLDDVEGETGPSHPVWLRIEVDDFQFDGTPTPKITATVAWGNCAAGQGIDACDHACRAVREDVDPIEGPDPENMAYPTGGRVDRWGMGFHDKDYLVELFRAGGE